MQRDAKFFLAGFLLFVIAPFSGTWASEFVKDGALALLGDTLWVRALLLLLAVAALFGILWWLYDYAKRLVRPEIGPIESVTPRKAIVAFLSPLNKKIKRIDGENGHAQGWRVVVKEGEEEEIRDLKSFASSSKNLSNWQQQARALYHHCSSLQHVVFLLPKKDGDSDGGNKQATGQNDVDPKEFFSDLLQKTVDSAITIETLGPIDFEDLAACDSALRQAIQRLKRCHLSTADIVIDITGGKKTASISGALVTLDDHNLIFQYIPTDDGGSKNRETNQDISKYTPKGYQVVACASDAAVV